MKRKNIIYIISVCILLAACIVISLCIGQVKDMETEGPTQPFPLTTSPSAPGTTTPQVPGTTAPSAPGTTAPEDPVRPPEKIAISGSVTWNDEKDQDGKRPGSVTVRLLADGREVARKTVTATDNWAFRFTELDKFSAGKEIVYTTVQDAVDGYTTAVDGFCMTNSYTPETTRITVQKAWDDGNDRDGKRPESVTIRLYRNGEEYKTATLTAGMGWEYSFEGLSVYENGQKIVYTVTADPVEGYTVTADGFRLVGVHQPEKTDISGSVIWDDNEDQDGKRPAAVTIHLLADGQEVSAKTVAATDGWKFRFTDLYKYAGGKEIVYSISADTVEEYTTELDDFNVTNHHTPQTTGVTVQTIWADGNDQDGKRPESVTIRLWADGVEIGAKEITGADEWKCTFADLPVYKDGAKIVYTVTEDQVPGYTVSYDGFSVTNAYTPGKTQVSGSALWDDGNDRDGKRPDSITVRLWADGVEVRSLTVTEDDSWAWNFTDLDQYSAGKRIVYTVTQDAVAGYTTTVDGSAVTNSYKPEVTTVSGSVIWNDGNNQDGKRPDSVTVRVWADGREAASKTVTAADNWVFSFAELARFAAGKQIAYTVTQDAVAGYTTTVDGSAVTNSYTPEETTVSGSVTWNDGNDQDGKRPTSMTVRLYKDGKEYKTATVTANGGWKYTFEGLPVYENGRKIVYTVKADAVTGYTVAVDGFRLACTHQPEKTGVSGSVTWNDGNNQDGKRPESITVNLLLNGQKVSAQTVNATGGWKFSFTDLDKYAGGKEIAYSISVDAVENYVIQCDGFLVTASRVPQNNEEEDLGPAFSIVLRPEASGTQVKSNEVAIIDYSNVVDGYVMVKYTAASTVRLRAQVIGPGGTTYTYDIRPGQWAVFPLSDGNGTYRVRILENVVDNRYASVISVSTEVTLKDGFTPFLRPNQYVNYENATKTVETAAELCRGKTKLLDKVEVIYKYVIKTLSYDYDKAATVQSGYLPDLDAVLAAKKGICFDYAALMTAMLRSQGIPCKLVVGYAGTAYHAWISVWSEETGWVDGVVYFDGTTWQRMDPTFMSTSGGSQSTVNFIKNDANYTTKYLY